MFCYVGDRIAPTEEREPQRTKIDRCFPWAPSVSTVRAGTAAGASRTEGAGVPPSRPQRLCRVRGGARAMRAFWKLERRAER